MPGQVSRAVVTESSFALYKQIAGKRGEHAGADSAGGRQGRHFPIFKAAGAGLGEQFFAGYDGNLQANRIGRHEVEGGARRERSIVSRHV